jgi:hypothetical protein
MAENELKALALDITQIQQRSRKKESEIFAF